MSNISECSWAVGGCTWTEDEKSTERVRVSVGDSTALLIPAEARKMVSLLLLCIEDAERTNAEAEKESA